MKRTAKAHWEGNVKLGKGDLTTQSEVLKQANYSFKSLIRYVMKPAKRAFFMGILEGYFLNL